MFPTWNIEVSVKLPVLQVNGYVDMFILFGKSYSFNTIDMISYFFVASISEV